MTASTESVNGAEQVTWDLSDLAPALVDAAAARQFQERMTAASDDFRRRYQGTVGQLGADELAEALWAANDLLEAAARQAIAAHLSCATDTSDQPRAAAQQQAQELTTAIYTSLGFFAAECSAIAPERQESLLAAPPLAAHGRLLRSLWQRPASGLSEAEERIMAEKSLTGAVAWRRLFAILISRLAVQIGDRRMPLEEALSLLEQPDRALRRLAADSLSRALEDDLATRAFVINTLALDRINEERLRAGPGTAVPARGSEGADASVVAAASARYDICRRYYRLKACLIGGERISFDADRLAPVGAGSEAIPWDQARRAVVDGFASFSPELGGIAQRFFDRRWVDAATGVHKLPHAFTVAVPGGHPYVLLTYAGTLRSLLTLAHELGDGVRGVLASEQPLFYAQPPLAISEAASVFAEHLTFRHLMALAPHPRRRLELLMTLLDSVMNLVFRHVAITQFEESLYQARRARAELSADDISSLWMEAHRAMLGDSVELPESFRSWWSHVPHLVGDPGHETQHAMGCLLGQAIHRRHGPSLTKGYIEMMKAGGSDTLEALVGLVGIDLGAGDLWKDEVEALDGMVAEAEQLAGEAEPTP